MLLGLSCLGGFEGVEEGWIRGGGRYTLRAAKITLKCLWKPIPPTHSRPLRVASARDNTLCTPKCQVKTAWYFSRPCLWGLGGPGRARVYGNPPGIFELRVYGNVRRSGVACSQAPRARSPAAAVWHITSRPKYLGCGVPCVDRCGYNHLVSSWNTTRCAASTRAVSVGRAERGWHSTQ